MLSTFGGGKQWIELFCTALLAGSSVLIGSCILAREMPLLGLLICCAVSSFRDCFHDPLLKGGRDFSLGVRNEAEERGLSLDPGRLESQCENTVLPQAFFEEDERT